MIVAAAIVRNGVVWALPAPKRHHDLIRLMADRGEAVPGLAAQGFVDSNEGFVSRERAREIALAEGQVERPDHATKLFSEDLW